MNYKEDGEQMNKLEINIKNVAGGADAVFGNELVVEFDAVVEGVPFGKSGEELILDKEDYENLDSSDVKYHYCSYLYEELRKVCEENGVDLDDFEEAFDEFAEDVVDLVDMVYEESDLNWYNEHNEDKEQMDINYNFGEVSFTADDDHLKVSIIVTPEYTDCHGVTWNNDTEELNFVFHNYFEYEHYDIHIIHEATNSIIKDFMDSCWEEGFEYGYFKEEELLFRNKLIKHIKECYEHAIEIGNLKNWSVDEDGEDDGEDEF